jgi:serine/threonine-protein kinase RsbW
MSNKSFYSSFKAKLEYLNDIIEFTEKCLEESGCPLKCMNQVCIALEEAFVNVASYAYPQSDGEVELRIEYSPDCVQLVLSDEGLPFNPLERDEPDITLNAEEREIGGLGIFMIKKIMDDVSYSCSSGKNILTMKKYCS